METVATCSQCVRFESFHALCLPCNKTNTLVVSDFRPETLRFSTYSQNQSFNGAFAECGGSNPPGVATSIGSIV